MGLGRQMSIRAIAAEIGRGHSTVADIVKKFNETGSMENTLREGRPRETSPKDDRALKFKSLKDRKLTAVDLAADLKDDKGKPIASICANCAS